MLTHFNLLANMIQHGNAGLIGRSPAPDNLEIMNILALFYVCRPGQEDDPMAKKEEIVRH
jgi:hypothetical protein